MRKEVLTVKEHKLIQGIAEGKSRKAAAIAAGYSEQSAHVIASETLKKPKVQKALKELMEEKGLDNSSLLGTHKQLIEATKVISCGNESREVPDWQARARGLEMAYKLRGLFQEQLDVTVETHEQMLARLKGQGRS